MNGRIARTALLVAGLLAAGCSHDPYAQWKKLDVVYAGAVPIYPGAQVEDAMGGDYYGDGLGDHVSETITYWFEIQPFERDKILAYYEKNLPNATKTVDEEGDVMFEVIPQGAQEGEKVWVIVEKDKFRIGEETKPGKHKEKGLL